MFVKIPGPEAANPKNAVNTVNSPSYGVLILRRNSGWKKFRFIPVAIYIY